MPNRTGQNNDAPRAERFRRALAITFTTMVWGGIAAAIYVRNKQRSVFTRSRRVRGSRHFEMLQERWASVYPTAEDYAGEETPVFPPQFDHQPNG